MRLLLQDRQGFVTRHLATALSAPSSEHELTFYNELSTEIRDNKENFAQQLASTDAIVLDLAASDASTTLQSLLTGIKDAEFDNPISILALSSLLTWNAGKAGATSKEKSYKKRTSSAKYATLKSLENIVLAFNDKENVNATLIARGCLYGREQEALHALFRSAWLSEIHQPSSIQGALPIIGDGLNRIPAIHIDNLSAIVQSVLTQPFTSSPADASNASPYLIAVDQSALTQQEIVNAISSTLGASASSTYSVSRASIDQDEHSLLRADSELVDWLSLDLAFDLQSLSIHERVIASEETEETDGSALKLKYKEGFVTHAAAIKEEFVQARKLHPVRVWVEGAPGSGRSRLARALAQKYQVPLLNIASLIEEAKARNDSLSTSISQALEAAAAATAAAKLEKPVKKAGAATKKPAGKNAATSQEDEDAVPRLSATLLAEIVRVKCQEPRCRNGGFILDGFPRTHQEAVALFHVPAPAQEEVQSNEEASEPSSDEQAAEGTSASEAEAGAEEVAEDASTDEKPEDEAAAAGAPLDVDASEDSVQEASTPVRDAVTCPTAIVSLLSSESECIARCKGLSYAELIVGHNDEEGISRRWSRHATASATESATQALPELEPLLINSETANDLQQSVGLISLLVERKGFFNYHPTPQEVAEAQRVLDEQQRIAEEQIRAVEELRVRDNEARQVAKAKADVERKAALDAEDALRIEAASAPLRAYLLANVLPAIVEGLTDCVQNKPEDPIEHLSEFLYRYALNAPATKRQVPTALTPQQQYSSADEKHAIQS